MISAAPGIMGYVVSICKTVKSCRFLNPRMGTAAHTHTHTRASTLVNGFASMNAAEIGSLGEAMDGRREDSHAHVKRQPTEPDEL